MNALVRFGVLKCQGQLRYLDREYCLIDYLLKSILRGEGLWSQVNVRSLYNKDLETLQHLVNC